MQVGTLKRGQVVEVQLEAAFRSSHQTTFRIVAERNGVKCSTIRVLGEGYWDVESWSSG